MEIFKSAAYACYDFSLGEKNEMSRAENSVSRNLFYFYFHVSFILFHFSLSLIIESRIIYDPRILFVFHSLFWMFANYGDNRCVHRGGLDGNS